MECDLRQFWRCRLGEKRNCKLHVLDFPEGKGFLHEEETYSIEGSPYGTAFRTMKPLAAQQTHSPAGSMTPSCQSRNF